MIDPPSAGTSTLHKVAAGVMASSAAMTLMACYGAACTDEEFCGGPGDSGGLEETCDEMTPTEVIEEDAPLSVDGTLIAEGSNVGSCGGGGGEVVYIWTPPVAGPYLITTTTALDTVLYVRSTGVCGDELACNDDVGGGDTSSSLLVDLPAEPVAIVVDGYSSAHTGAFTLTIESQ